MKRLVRGFLLVIGMVTGTLCGGATENTQDAFARLSTLCASLDPALARQLQDVACACYERGKSDGLSGAIAQVVPDREELGRVGARTEYNSKAVDAVRKRIDDLIENCREKMGEYKERFAHLDTCTDAAQRVLASQQRELDSLLQARVFLEQVMHSFDERLRYLERDSLPATVQRFVARLLGYAESSALSSARVHDLALTLAALSLLLYGAKKVPSVWVPPFFSKLISYLQIMVTCVLLSRGTSYVRGVLPHAKASLSLYMSQLRERAAELGSASWVRKAYKLVWRKSASIKS